MHQLKCFISICLCLGTGHVLALPILSLEPASQTGTVGDSFSVDLVISDLGDGVDPSLGAFFTEFLFDDSILVFDSVSYGLFLGDTDPLAFETDIVTTSGFGFVSLDEFSFLFDFELDALQPASFILATLLFDGVGNGTTALGFGFIDLSDAIGFSLTPALVGASVTVTVPEPGTFLLLAWGMVLLILRGKYAHQRIS